MRGEDVPDQVRAGAKQLPAWWQYRLDLRMPLRPYVRAIWDLCLGNNRGQPDMMLVTVSRRSFVTSGYLTENDHQLRDISPRFESIDHVQH